MVSASALAIAGYRLVPLHVQTFAKNPEPRRGGCETMAVLDKIKAFISDQVRFLSISCLSPLPPLDSLTCSRMDYLRQPSHFPDTLLPSLLPLACVPGGLLVLGPGSLVRVKPAYWHLSSSSSPTSLQCCGGVNGPRAAEPASQCRLPEAACSYGGGASGLPRVAGQLTAGLSTPRQRRRSAGSSSRYSEPHQVSREILQGMWN